MNQSLAAFQNNLTKIRTGRANSALLDSIHVEYYGSQVPLSQVANVSVLDSRTHQRPALGKRHGRQDRRRPSAKATWARLNPASMGDLIRVPLPRESEERRKEMTKLVRNEGETAKVTPRVTCAAMRTRAIRN